MPSGIPAPPSLREPAKAGRLTRGQVSHHGTLDAFVLTPLPTPLARGRGVTPPTPNRSTGVLLLLARRSSICWQFRRGSPLRHYDRHGWRCCVTGCGWTPGPTVLLRCTAAPDFATLHFAKWLRACGLQDSRQAPTACGRQRLAKVADGHLRACSQALHAVTVIS